MSRGRLGRAVLRWTFSRGRWIQEVAVEALVGAAFLAAPRASMDLLAIRTTPEAVALFRLYGILLVARGLLHHTAFRIRERRVVLRWLVADLAFTVPSAAVLVAAIREGLAGGAAAWAVVALFVGEAAVVLTSLVALRRVTDAELQRAQDAVRR